MRGGHRDGAGRPASGIRPSHNVRAWESEWDLIKIFVSCVRKDAGKAKEILSALLPNAEKKV